MSAKTLPTRLVAVHVLLAFVVTSAVLVGWMSVASDVAQAGKGFKKKPARKVESKARPRVPQVDAAKLETTVVTPHLEAEHVDGKSLVWCSTFQMAWNELLDLCGGSIEMEPAPEMLAALNKRLATKEDVDTESRVVQAGVANTRLFEKIRRELRAKGRGERMPPLLIDAARRNRKSRDPELLAYAYLAKTLSFETKFEPLRGKLEFVGAGDGKKTKVDAFGVTDEKGTDERLRQVDQVRIRDYQNAADFVIELKPRDDGDQIILAKVAAKETLAKTVTAVLARAKNRPEAGRFILGKLRVAIVDFNLLRQYDELIGRDVITPNPKTNGLPVTTSLQSIRFRLDEAGAVLESEALMGFGGGFADEGPRVVDLIFDKPFLVLLKRRESERPYLAVWVANPELLVKARAERKAKPKPEPQQHRAPVL